MVNYDCVVEVNNSDLKLLPGMTANVSVIVAERQNSLKIPNAALRFRPPEAVIAETKTNVALRASAPAATGGTRPNGEVGTGRGAGREGGPGGGPGAGGGPGGGRRGEGGPSGREMAAGGAHPRPERQLARTVYILPGNGGATEGETSKPVPVQIKIGISDGISTEVTEGLSEGQKVAIGIISSAESGTGGRPSNPFGGGFRRF